MASWIIKPMPGEVQQPTSFLTFYKIISVIYLSIGVLLFTGSVIGLFSLLGAPETDPTLYLGITQPGIVILLRKILITIPFLVSGIGFGLNNKLWIRLALAISAIISLNFLTGLQHIEEEALNEVFRTQKILGVGFYNLIEAFTQALLLILTAISSIVVVAAGRKTSLPRS
jgi:hypothetical protein